MDNIDDNTYAEALKKLKEKEEHKKRSIVNGHNFMQELQSCIKNGKNTFILFHLNGCPGCTVIKYLLNNNSDIKQKLEKYNVLYYNAEDTKSILIEKFNVYSYPYMIILDKNEKVLKKHIGVFSLDQLDKLLFNWIP